MIGLKANLKRQMVNSTGLTVKSIEHTAKSIGKFVLSSNVNGQSANYSGSIAKSNTKVVISIGLFINSTEKRCNVKRHMLINLVEENNVNISPLNDDFDSLK